MITDKFLENLAKAVNSESYNVPAYLAVGTTAVTSIDPEDIALSGEIGTRVALTGARTNKEVEFSAIRSSVDVLDTTNGDSLTNLGLFSTTTQSTSDPLKIGITVAGITQTTNFDIEVVTTLTAVRT